MKAYVNGQEQKIYTALVLPAPYNQTEECPYLAFSQKEPSELQIAVDEEIQKVVIRPLSKAIEYSFTDRVITIPSCGNDNFSVEYNDKCVLVFATEKREEIYEGKIVRFEKGYHSIGKKVFTEDDLTVILEEGAYLDGKLEFNGCNNLKVCGGGILSNQSYHNQKHRVIFDLLACKNVVVKDLVLTDSEFWNMRVFGCENVLIHNVKIIGSYPNSDGFDICGSQNVTVSHCFTRTRDDSLVIKAFDDRDKTSIHVVFEGSGTDMTKAFEQTGNCQHVQFTDCVLWNDFARPIELGVSMRCDEVSDIHFENIDIIHSPTGYPLIGSHHGDRAEVHDIYFNDVRIEDCPGAQLFDFRITSSGWNTDTRKGSMHDLYFKDIRVIGRPGIPYLFERSRIEGFSEENKIQNVVFEDIDLLGNHPGCLEELNMETNEYVENVLVKAKEPNMHMVESKLSVVGEFVRKGSQYEGILKLELINTSEANVSGRVWLNISPKNVGSVEVGEVNYELVGKEEVQYLVRVVLPAGKSVVRVQSDQVNVISDWKLFEFEFVLGEKPISCELVNYYGVRRTMEVKADSIGITIRSDIMKDGNLFIYAATPAEKEEGEVLFTVEETDFAESMAVCQGKDGKPVMAPQLRCPAEIWYVFHNMPKVKKGNRVELGGKEEFFVTYEELGIEKEDFILEFLANVPEMEKYRYPLTLFHSVTPEETCHMFAKTVIE